MKPANVLVADEDHVYLTDFGLSKHVASDGRPDQPGQWVGTVDYVAPEQIQGLPVTPADRRLLARLRALRDAVRPGPLRAGRRDLAKLWAHVNAAPPSLLPVRPDLPAAFDRIVRRAMAKSPASATSRPASSARAVLPPRRAW